MPQVSAGYEVAGAPATQNGLDAQFNYLVATLCLRFHYKWHQEG
jgi:hypothetical protein